MNSSKNKKIVFLEVNAKGPSDYHSEFFKKSKNYDFFYVTFKENVLNDDRCLGFFPNTVWAETRNKLYELVPKQYDYYCFMDDDIIYESSTEYSFIDQLLLDLEKTKPAVMSPYYKNDHNEGIPYDKGNYYLNYFGNNCCKIYNSKFLNYFYPLVTKYGGIFDSAHLVNILELIFINKIICSHNIFMVNPDHNFNYTNGAEKMNMMWNNTKYLLSNSFFYNITDSLFIKKKYLQLNKKIEHFQNTYINFEGVFLVNDSWIHNRFKLIKE